MLLTLLLPLREYYCSLTGYNAIAQLYNFLRLFEDILASQLLKIKNCMMPNCDNFAVLQVLINILIDYGILKFEIPTFRTRYVKGIEHGISRIIQEPHYR